MRNQHRDLAAYMLLVAIAACWIAGVAVNVSSAMPKTATRTIVHTSPPRSTCLDFGSRYPTDCPSQRNA